MLCDNCGKEPARVHYKEIKDDKAVEFNLCEKCAAEKGIQVVGKKKPFSIASILAGMAEEATSSTARCQTCGLSYAEFRENARLGCADCYSAFREQLKPLLKRIHGSGTHLGKAPSSSEGLVERMREIEDLKAQLRAAVEQEDFEKAAEIRDRIKCLEGGEAKP